MPFYSYRCPQGHDQELLRPREVVSVPCPCGEDGIRQAVNRLAVIGKAVIPRDQRSYRQTFSEYNEALAEVADSYARVNDSRPPEDHVQQPDYFGLATKQAVDKGVPIRGA